MNRDLEQIIMAAGDLPTIPIVATKVMQLMEDENATADDLARVVASDPAVAARVLKISNSSFYGCQRQIQTLPHAIMMLGFVTLKSVVVAASVKQVYHPFGLTEKLLWEHSFGAGLAARIIASDTRLVNAEEAFLGGLFHDLGKIIMNFLDKEKFQEVMQRCYNDGIDFEQAERTLFPYTHEEVGALVIKKWNFPDHLMKAVMAHHTLALAEDEDPYLVRLTCVVSLANIFCHRYGIGTIAGEEEIDVAATLPATTLGLTAEKVDELLFNFKEAYDKDQTFFT
ncbi:MAG: HDOD domain-containing protein [Geobacter sp.]|jgi:putative nucleotidyltransferase with HDIG domain|uniref:HDOD domain-containing protein n=1 Tax=Trichlorobacter sp. TaxID=2911007 RepID=UPI002A36EF33|nr:HDOD domain-containing protein [Trichlorobacter sp.]MDY0383233.1 HDOD domain-containing protein [Trichlorobacter sp.]